MPSSMLFCPVKFECQINNEFLSYACVSNIACLEFSTTICQISCGIYTYAKNCFCCFSEIQILLGVLYCKLLNLAILFLDHMSNSSYCQCISPQRVQNLKKLRGEGIFSFYLPRRQGRKLDGDHLVQGEVQRISTKFYRAWESHGLLVKFWVGAQKSIFLTSSS